MSTLLFGRDAAVAAWVAQRMPTPTEFGPCAAIGIARGDRLVAGCVYTDYRAMPFGADVRISFAADDPRWATKGNIAALLRYPFLQVQCRRVTTITSRNNKRARRFVEGIGFRLEGVVRKAYDGRADAILYGMLRDECRWLSNMPPTDPVYDLRHNTRRKAVPAADIRLANSFSV